MKGKLHEMNEFDLVKESMGSNSSDGVGTTNTFSESDSQDDDARSFDEAANSANGDSSNRQFVPDDDRARSVATVVDSCDGDASVDVLSETKLISQEGSSQDFVCDQQDEPPVMTPSQADGHLGSSASTERLERSTSTEPRDLQPHVAAQSLNLGEENQRGSNIEASQNLASRVGEPAGPDNNFAAIESSQPAIQSSTLTPLRAHRRERRPRHASRIQPTDISSPSANIEEDVSTSPGNNNSNPARASSTMSEGTYADRVRRKLASYPGVAAPLASVTPSTGVTLSDHGDVGSTQTQTSELLPPAVGISADLSSSQSTSHSSQSIDNAHNMETAENISTSNNEQSSSSSVVPSNESATTLSSSTSYAARLQRKRNQGEPPRATSEISSPSGTASQLSDDAPPARTQSMFQSPPVSTLSSQPSSNLNTSTSSILPRNCGVAPSRGDGNDWIKPPPTIANLLGQLSSPTNSTQMSSRSLTTSGMDEGDQFFAALNRGLAPATSNELRTARPVATPRHRVQDSFSYLPAETRGDYITGGQGMLVSDEIPGAFQALGRAFGDVPDWIRNPRNNGSPPVVGNVEGAASGEEISLPTLLDVVPESELGVADKGNNDNFRDIRMSTAQGSFTIRAQYQDGDSVADNFDFDGLEVVQARLLEKSASQAIIEETEEGDVEEGESSPENRVILSPEDAAYEAAAIDDSAIFSAEEVTNEEVLKEATAKATVRTIYFTIAILTIVLISLIVIFSVGKDDDSNSTVPALAEPAEPLALFPRFTSLPSRKTMYKTVPSDIFDDFSPIVECYCGRKIPGIPAKIIDSHAYLVRLLLVNGIINYPPLPTDCSDPQNLAILWMAEAEPLVKTVDETITRYLLAVLFHSLGGLGWSDNTFWLTNRSECAWHGVRCNSYFVISQIQLPDNGLAGSIHEQLAKLPYLQTFNVTGNSRLVGKIPEQVELLMTDGKLSVYANGTSISRTPGKWVTDGDV